MLDVDRLWDWQSDSERECENGVQFTCSGKTDDETDECR